MIIRIPIAIVAKDDAMIKQLVKVMIRTATASNSIERGFQAGPGSCVEEPAGTERIRL